MGEDDLTDIYRLEAAKSLESEAAKRIAEAADPVRDARLRATALKDLLDSDDLVPAIFARLGIVRAALEGHGGGVKVEQATADEKGVDLILSKYQIWENVEGSQPQKIRLHLLKVTEASQI